MRPATLSALQIAATKCIGVFVQFAGSISSARLNHAHTSSSFVLAHWTTEKLCALPQQSGNLQHPHGHASIKISRAGTVSRHPSADLANRTHTFKFPFQIQKIGRLGGSLNRLPLTRTTLPSPDLFVRTQENWCGRPDLNRHGITPNGF